MVLKKMVFVQLPIEIPPKKMVFGQHTHLCRTKVLSYLYFNGMRVISWKAEGAAGAIGYATDEGVGYTAFSNDVFGSSDFETFKNFPTKFPATSYLKGENRGFSIAKAKRVAHGVRVGEKESTVRIGDANAVALAKGDWVKYAVDVWENGVYTIAAEVSPKSAGAKIKIRIGMSELTATIPTLDESCETVRVYLGSIKVESGVQTMRVEVLSGNAEITLFGVRDGNLWFCVFARSTVHLCGCCNTRVRSGVYGRSRKRLDEKRQGERFGN